MVVKTNGIPFWGRCTTHFKTYFSGDWDVHWGYGILTHGQMKVSRITTSSMHFTKSSSPMQLPLVLEMTARMMPSVKSCLESLHLSVPVMFVPSDVDILCFCKPV